MSNKSCDQSEKMEYLSRFFEGKKSAKIYGGKIIRDIVESHLGCSEGVSPYDLIFDSEEGDNLERSWGELSHGGVYVIYGCIDYDTSDIFSEGHPCIRSVVGPSPLIYQGVDIYGRGLAVIAKQGSIDEVTTADDYVVMSAPIPSDITVVTALYDIQKEMGKNTAVRDSSFYLSNYSRVMSGLDANVVIFTSPDLADRVGNMRKRAGLGDKTKVIVRGYPELPLFPRLPEMRRAVQNLEPGSYNLEKDTPEYSLLTHAKVHFAAETAKTNPFYSRYFMWLDYGIGYSPAIKTRRDMVNFEDNIRNNLNPGKIRAVCTRKLAAENYSDLAKFLRKMYNTQVVGGCWTGDTQAMLNLCKEYYLVVEEALDKGMIALDETIMGITLARNPELNGTIGTGWHPDVMDFRKGYIGC